MHTNYQKELDRLLSSLGGERKKLLLHACCAPCSSYCIEYLSAYFDITLLFYNPNMCSLEEYDKRAKELIRLVGCMESDALIREGSVRCVIEDYDNTCFEQMARGLWDEPERGRRCEGCYGLRLSRAAEYAADNGFDFFTTTLSISPLKSADMINDIGVRLEKEYGVMHLPSDFKKREGFKRSIELSERYGLYRQNFCGCRFSRPQI